MKNIHFIAPL